jgi:hypothetical protein
MEKIINNGVFVFGSNAAGVHGAGAALRAYEVYGAEWGKGEGLQNESYAIPTKARDLKVLPLDKIERFVTTFKLFAQNYPEKTFYVTEIGTGLANYQHKDIAPLFKNSPHNCVFSLTWKEYLGDNYSYFQGNL